MATIISSSGSTSYQIPYNPKGENFVTSSIEESVSAIKNLDENSRTAKSDLLVDIQHPQSVTVSTTVGHKRTSGGFSRDEAIALYLQVAQYL